ncbi:unnamed protein product, partial [Onchocerca ochengi]
VTNICLESKLTPLYRENIVAQINKYRSDLVNGKLKNADGKLLPRGKNMLEMTWDCKLENSAQKWADQCAFRHSPENQRVGIGENIYTFRLSRSVEIFNTTASMIAVGSWGSQLSQSYKNNPSNT